MAKLGLLGAMYTNGVGLVFFFFFNYMKENSTDFKFKYSDFVS